MLTAVRPPELGLGREREIIRSEADKVGSTVQHRSHRGPVVLKHLPGLLIGAPLLKTLPLQVPHLQLLQPARVVPPGPDLDDVGPVRVQEAIGPIRVQEHFQTEGEEVVPYIRFL